MGSWETQSSGYDQRKFYTQASDKKGHWHQLNIKLPTTVAGEIAKLVQSGAIDEYTSTQAFVRDAIIHRLEYISRYIESEDLRREISLHTIHAEAILKKDKRERFRRMMLDIQENCQYYSNHGKLEELRGYVSGLLDQAVYVPEEHRPEYIGELEQQLKIAQRY